MSLPDGANFFELLQVPQQFEQDLNLLGQHYRLAQQQAHPDQAAGGAQAVAGAMRINQAYETLKAPDRRATYLLQLAGEAHGLEKSIADVEFLQQALELREQLDEASDAEELEAVTAECQQWLEALSREFVHDHAEQDWLEARDTTRKMAFIQRLLDDVARRQDQAEDEWLDDGF